MNRNAPILDAHVNNQKRHPATERGAFTIVVGAHEERDAKFAVNDTTSSSLPDHSDQQERRRLRLR